MIVKNLYTSSRKINNYLEDATDNAAGNLKFDSTTVATLTVPTGYRWLVIGGAVNRDVSGTLAVVGKDTSDKLIYVFHEEGASTTHSAWPANAAAVKESDYNGVPILDPGEYVEFTFGAAQSTACSVSCVVLEVAI